MVCSRVLGPTTALEEACNEMNDDLMVMGSSNPFCNKHLLQHAVRLAAGSNSSVKAAGRSWRYLAQEHCKGSPPVLAIKLVQGLELAALQQVCVVYMLASHL